MHEVRVTVPEQLGEKAARLGLQAGIQRVSVADVYLHGPDRPGKIVSAETSTPKAKAFVDALQAAPWFDRRTCSITARELRAIVSSESAAEVTRPQVEPEVDVLQDLWQLSHITASYVGRAVSAAILLSYSMLENSAIGIVVAALFLPFLSQVTALSFGVWMRDWRLARHGALAICVSIASCIGAGALVAAIHGGPMLFQNFQRPAVSFAISAVIGVAAGLAIADDAGRRYMIGVAAAVQYSIFPCWIGIALVLGFPDRLTVFARLESFAINISTIAAAAALAYASSGLARKTRQGTG